MKTRLTIITSILLSLIIFPGCQSESTPENLQEDVKEIKRIANNSENIEDKEDAFEILRNLNQKMKDVRDNILAMEAKYRTASENKKREMESEFKEANAQIDESLGVIRENVDPYKNEQEVSKMIDKLNEILISK